MKEGVDGEARYAYLTPLQDKDPLKPDCSLVIEKKMFLKEVGDRGGMLVFFPIC